jgi:HEPN domain-containing protein
LKIALLLNDFAIRCFRDIADGDYVSARMAYRAVLIPQFLWASQQAIEKYLKCILLLNRIPDADVRHDLTAALIKVYSSGNIALDLKLPTKEFIEYIDTYGRFRYLEASPVSFGNHIVMLDRTVWELRRFCTLDEGPRQLHLRHGDPAPKIRLEGGELEKIMDDPRSPAREPLLWQNAFFGKRARRRVRARAGFTAINSPLFLNPRILEEVLKYVFLPAEIKAAYREAARKTPKL